MGKRSVRENKNAFQLAREAAELTRDAAAEKMVFVSSDRIEKIESGRSQAHPDEVLAMAECYKAPLLTNYFCSTECPIGQKYIPKISKKELPQITLEILDELNELEKDRNRFITIAADSRVTPDELPDFEQIRSKLSRLSLAFDTLELWLEQSIADGEIQM